MDSIYLQGAEEISKAAYVIRDAAEDIKTASYNLANALEFHQQFLTQWLVEFRMAIGQGVASNVPD